MINKNMGFIKNLIKSVFIFKYLELKFWIIYLFLIFIKYSPKKEKHKKIIYIYQADIPSYNYRCVNLAESAEFAGWQTKVIKRYRLAISDLFEYDIFVFHRTEYTKFIKVIVKILVLLNKTMVYDIDDLIFGEEFFDLLSQTDQASLTEKKVLRRHLNLIRKCLNLFDLVSVTTEKLVDEILKINKQPILIENVLADNFFQIVQKQIAPTTGDIILGYSSGSATHQKDFMIVAPALVKILAEYPQVKLMVIGNLEIPKELNQFQKRIIYHPLVALASLPEFINNFTINLAPLENTRFCLAKSSVKYLEAGIFAIPTVASAVFPYARLIKHQQNGLLCLEAGDWYNNLRLLVTDEALRKSLGESAKEQVLSGYTSRAYASKLANIYLKLQ